MVLDSQICAAREEKYRGLVVITGHDGIVITAYKNRKASKKIRKGQKYKRN